MKKTYKRRVVFVLTLALLISAFTVQAADPITIRFWNAFTGSDGDILREIVSRFNNENTDGIRIEMDIMPGTTLTQKLAPAIATGTAPDMILAGNMDVPMYAKNGNMLPMNDFFAETDVAKNNFVPAALEGLQYEGSQIMIPMQWFTTYLYYNKDLFEKAGLDPEDPPKTWNEIAEYAAEITDSDKRIYGVGFCVSGGVSWFSSLFLSNGGQVFDIENLKSELVSQDNLDSLQYIQDIVEAGHSPKGSTGADLDNLMMADRLGMVINGPWMVNGLKENEISFGVTGMPAGKDGQVGIAEITGFAIPKGTSDEARDAAYKFIAYWNSIEIGKEWSMRNGFPPYLKSVMEDEDIKNNEIVSVFSGIANYGVSFGQGLSSTTQINNDILFPMVENVVAGADPEKELKNASEQIDKVLETEE